MTAEDEARRRACGLSIQHVAKTFQLGGKNTFMVSRPVNAGPTPGTVEGEQSKPDEEPSGLASLLGQYSDDEEGGSPQSSQGKGIKGSGPSTEPNAASAADELTDDMDLELSRFMQQLESDGLLKDPAPTDTQPTDPASPAPTPAESEATAAPAHRAASAQADSDTVITHSTQDANLAGDSQAGDTSDQQVLGYLRGAPSWCKCLDASSGLPYFWNLETNEVVWEVPEGLNGDDLIPPEATSAGDHAADQPMTDAAADAGGPTDAKQQQDSEGKTAAGQESGAVPDAKQGDSAGAAGRSEVPARDGSKTPEPGAGAGKARQGQDQSAGQGQGTQSLADMAAAYAAVAEQAAASAQYYLARMPRIVRAALEAQTRAADLQAACAALSGQSDAAAAAAASDAAAPWQWYLSHTQEALLRQQGELPAAIAEASKLQQAGLDSAAAQDHTDPSASKGTKAQTGSETDTADVEDGELPITGRRSIDGRDSSGGVRGTDTGAWDSDLAAARGARSRGRSARYAGHSAYDWAAHSAYNTAYPSHAYYAAAGGYYPYAHDASAYYAAYGMHAAADTPPLPPEADGDVPVPPPPPASGVGDDDDDPPGMPPPPPSVPPLPFDDPTSSSDMETEQHNTAYHAAQAHAAGAPPYTAALHYASTDQQASSSTAADAAAAARRREYAAAPVRNVSVASQPSAATGGAGAAQAPDEATKTGTVKRKSSSGAKGEGSGSSKKAKSDGSVKLSLGSKKVGALVNQWVSVRKHLAEEEEREAQQEAEAQDPEAMERKRLKELEAWRRQQETSAEEAAANANFAPVQGDWRKTLAMQLGASEVPPAAPTTSKKHKSSSHKSSKRDKTAAAGAASAKEAAAAAPATTKPRATDMASLSAGLPPGWRVVTDKETGDIYWENPSTKEVSWTKP